MLKRKIIIILAATVAVIPFLGFPGSWEETYVVIAGILIVLFSLDFSFLKKKKRSRRQKKTLSSDVFVENAPTKMSDEFKSEFKT